MANKTNSAVELSRQNPSPLVSTDHIPQPTTSQSRKRKHNEITDCENLGGPFTIQAFPGSSSKTSLTFVPRLVIPRSCLPLALLDPNGTSGHLEGNRIFSAKTPSLATSLSPGKHIGEPVVLIAESSATPRFYAVEQVRPGIYALCQLYSWITLKNLEKLNLGSKSQFNLGNLEKAVLPGDKWWHQAAIQSDGAIPSMKRRKSWTAEGIQLCLKSPMHQNSIAASPGEIECGTRREEPLPTFSRTVEDLSLQGNDQNADEILNMIRSQYREALYMSQASLAYYAKGPLSRARAFFQGSNVSSSDRGQLPEFLRSCILNLPTLDKKYRETIPDLVKQLPMAALSDDEIVVEALRKKSRKSKKCTLGKNGLYPEEELNIARWWISRTTATDIQDTALSGEDSIKARISLQKAREIQLQIILILETLALELSTPEIKVEGISSQALGEDHLETNQKHKIKKPKDLNTVLDLLVDKLCIWQSMNTNEAEKSPNGKFEAPQKRNNGTNQSSRVNSLRVFCVDVVIPFYGARLPSLSNMLCEKFGGPKQHSPARPPLVKAATIGDFVRPGTSLRRQPMQKSRRTLERVLTDERIASRRPTPSLSRSATDSVLPGLKREGSAVSLYSIPPAKLDIQNSRRYSQREVDLSAAAQAYEAKLKKKAKVEKELQGAIAALKKPNPRMAVKEFVEAAERRAAASNPRKSKLSGRNSSVQGVQGVQVMATPSVNRRKDVFGNVSHKFNTASGVDEIPPSSAVQVVSCTPRAKGDSAKNRPDRHLSTVHEQTPSRGPLKVTDSRSNLSAIGNRPETNGQLSRMVSDDRQSLPLSNKSDARHLGSLPSGTFRTPTKIRSIDPQRNNPHEGIKETPVKVSRNALETIPEKPTPLNAINENNVSIYDSLGWNDDIDELS